ncbi:MAG: amidohydrolase family protein [Candidatus Njordarchaeia archaeon]
MKFFYSEHAIVGTNLKVEHKVYLAVSDNGYIVKYSKEKPKNSIEEEYDDAVIVPGFVNLHTHIGDSFAKEAAYGMDVKSAVGYPNGIKHKLLSIVDFDKFSKGVKNAIKEMLASGITAFVDFRENGVKGTNRLKKALEGEKIRAFILGRTRDPNEWEKILDIADGVGLPSLNGYSDEEIKQISKMAYNKRKYFTFHASETVEQRKKSVKKFGLSDLMRGLLLSHPNFIVHATNVDLSEIEKIASNNIPVILCPRANAYLGSGIPPILEFVKNRINLGLGTDNVMINAPDMFREFDFIVRITRLQGAVISPKEVLKMVTKNAAKILNLPIGLLDEGFHADFFVFDLNKPNVSFVENIVKAIVLRGKSENVIATYIGGEKIYER